MLFSILKGEEFFGYTGFYCVYYAFRLSWKDVSIRELGVNCYGVSSESYSRSAPLRYVER